MRKFFVVLAIVVMAFASSGYADLINGDFSNLLTGWGAIGDVGVVSDAARLGDLNSLYTALFQGEGLAPGNYVVEFDFFNGLSAEVPDFTFPDTLFASLYFVNIGSPFDPENGLFDGALALLDMDNAAIQPAIGTLTADPGANGWWHYSASFYNSYDFVFPTFELCDFNGVGGDSFVLLDNVHLTPAIVPEPASILLMGAGLAGMLLRRRSVR